MISMLRAALLGLILGSVGVPTADAAAISTCSADVQSCVIGGGFMLPAGQSVQVGWMSLVMQSDGNLVLYRTGAALWASSFLPAQDAVPFTGPTQAMNCAQCFALFQTDGNLVLYAPAADGSGNKPYWASNTPANAGAVLALSSTNPLSIVSASGAVLWIADVDPPPPAQTFVGKLSNGPVALGLPQTTVYVTSDEQSMDLLWQGRDSFQPIVNMQVQTTPKVGASFVDGMDEGTQIVPVNGIWYLFNREYGFAPKPSQCQFDFSRIVVRSSADLGKSWSSETVVAEPNQAAGECALLDGRAFWDADTGTWHYLAQMLTSNATWAIDHFTRSNPSPLGAFTPDAANPVIKSGALWSKICGSGKSCPAGTADEGTPEISMKSNGLFYVTFHGALVGAQSPPVVTGYRGVAATSDFHTWMTSGNGLPNDAIWSSRDCQSWNVQWNASTGCIGGGYASTLVTWQYTYMLIESADMSLGCTAGQNWAIGLARAPNFAASGQWNQLPGNPLMDLPNGAPCSIQYPALFSDRGEVYVSYWTLGMAGPGDSSTLFHIARLRPVFSATSAPLQATPPPLQSPPLASAKTIALPARQVQNGGAEATRRPASSQPAAASVSAHSLAPRQTQVLTIVESVDAPEPF